MLTTIQKTNHYSLVAVLANMIREKMHSNFFFTQCSRFRSFLYAGVLATAFSSPAVAVDYYIDAGTGTNAAICGDSNNPCRTIGYVLLNKPVSSGDDFHLTGNTQFQVRGLSINTDLSFHGSGVASTILDAGGNGERHFRINAPGATVVFEDLSFIDGEATGGSGGALVVDDGTLELRRVEFRNNSALDGAALALNRGSVLSEDVTFFANNAAGNGGAIYVTDGTLEVLRVNFNNNSAENGGGVSLDGGSMISNDSDFSYNTAIDSGGGISCVWFYDGCSGLEIFDTTFENNTAGLFGGAIDTSATANIRRSDFRWNTTGGHGGAINADIREGDLDIRRSQFTENEGGSGGGIYIDDGDTEIRRSSFVRNVATLGGGGIHGPFSSPVPNTFIVTNTTFSANRAPSGGGISGGPGTLTFVTMVDNLGEAGFDHDLQGLFEINRSIITHPTLGVTGRECNFNQTGGTHNFIDSASCDPINADSDFNFGPHNNPSLLPLDYYGGRTLSYALKSTSIAVDKANNCSGPNGVIGTDQRGEDRPSVPDTACDVGAFERQH